MTRRGVPACGSGHAGVLMQYAEEPKARIMHRFSSRSGESAGLARRATEAPANVLLSTLRRPTECNAGRADDFVAAVENLCIVRATEV